MKDIYTRRYNTHAHSVIFFAMNEPHFLSLYFQNLFISQLCKYVKLTGMNIFIIIILTY